MSANVRKLEPADVQQMAQTDPLANRLRHFGDDLKHAKALVYDLETVLARMDRDSAELTEAGVTMTYTLGPIGDAAAAARRDMARPTRTTFRMPGGDEA